MLLIVCVIADDSRQFPIVAHHNVGVLWVELNVSQKAGQECTLVEQWDKAKEVGTVPPNSEQLTYTRSM